MDKDEFAPAAAAGAVPPRAPDAPAPETPGTRLLAPEGSVRLRLAAVGDIGVVGAATHTAARKGYPACFAPLQQVFAAADVAFANLEFPVAEAEWLGPAGNPNFRHEPGIARALQQAGVRVVSLANNHIMDAGERGLRRTLEACREAGLATVGAGLNLAEAREPVRLDVRGQRFVMLGYAAGGLQPEAYDRPGVAPLDLELVTEDVKRWRPQADVLVLSVHWGAMYVDQPPAEVVRLAEAMAGLGVDIVLGHHPHVLQGYRREAGTLTLFSLGEGVFETASGELKMAWTRERRRRAGAFIVEVAQHSGLVIHPMFLDEDGWPQPATGEVEREIVERMQRLSTGWDDPERQFRENAAGDLVRYELGAIGEFLRRGRFDRVLGLIAKIRPRHFAWFLASLRRRKR